MAAKKANDEVKLSDELTKIVDDLVSSSKSNGSISEDDIQVAIRDIDVNDDELSDLYDSLRVKGVEITTASEATVSFAIEDDAAEDDFSSDDDLDNSSDFDVRSKRLSALFLRQKSLSQNVLLALVLAVQILLLLCLPATLSACILKRLVRLTCLLRQKRFTLP